MGVNVSQPKIEDAPVNIIDASGEGLLIDFTVNSGADGIRVQIEDGTDPSHPEAEDHRWCANFTGSQSQVIPWDSFNTKCWGAGPNEEPGKDFDPATNKIAKVILYVPDDGPMGTAQNFDFCLNDIGPANVQGRGTGQIVASCGNTASWSGSTNVTDQYAKIATSDNRYRFQNNGWGWVNGNHTASLLPGARVHV